MACVKTERNTNMPLRRVSLYYLAVTDFSLVSGLPFAGPGPADLGLALAGVVPDGDRVVASCEALRCMGVVVLGGSMGTVGARTERGCRVGHTL